MQTVDCFFVGINTISIGRQRRLARMIHGEKSHQYRDDLNFRFIKYQDKLYTQSQIFEKLYNEVNQCQNGTNYEFPVFEDTFNSAIAYLGTYLHKRGFVIDYINSFNSEKMELAKKLQKNRIRCVAITTTHYTSAYPINEIVSFIRSYDPTVKIVVGGAYIASQALFLEEGALQRLLLSIGADIYVFSQEGEYALGQVIAAIKHNCSVDQIDNIYYRCGDRYLFTKASLEDNSLDENVIDWTLFADRLGKYVSVRTGKSCPFSCRFCTYGGRGFKQRFVQASLANLERELDCLKQTGKVAGIFFSDNTFNVSTTRFKNILKMMIEKNYGFKWQTHIRCQFLDRETVDLMKQSGCVQVFCGLESGSQQILDNMNKAATVDKYRQTIALLNEYEISTVASFFVGFPGETYETYRETYDLIEEIQPSFFQIRLWWYAQNAPIYDLRDQYLLTGSGFDWSHATMNSDTAHQLVDEMYLNIKNSVHIGDTQNVFDMTNRGFSLPQIRNFVSRFNDCVKVRLKNPENEETSDEMIRGMKESLGR